MSNELAWTNEEINRLKEQLDREQEWRVYEIKENVRQNDYENLVKQKDTYFLTDGEAKIMLYDWYGFATKKVTIRRTVPMYQINRHQQLRTAGNKNSVRLIMPQTGIISGLTAGQPLMSCLIIR